MPLLPEGHFILQYRQPGHHLYQTEMKYSNRLIHESSPYLLQHAHNPVNWYPWGEEALEKARTEDKPILVSIGYAACHWCHVMERESFEDAATAEIMNRCFINIKIDREERPDLDHLYMDAVQAMTGSGGWPLNVFLTPDTKPFYGGTYSPPVRAYNRASWKEILESVHHAFTEKRKEIEDQANHLTNHLAGSNAFGIGEGIPEEATLFTNEKMQEIARGILANADTVWGGFGKAPKFPQTFSIQFLLRQYHFTKDENALAQALLSLDKMIQGGIYDQLGGGFARYSTDNEWLAPHFEKMLYDNALLVSVSSEAYQLTHRPVYAETIRQTIGFLEREMLDPGGGFYSALDADSEGVEGKFYTWSFEEIKELLGEDALLFCNYYDIRPGGNWEHTNILRVLVPLEDFAIQQSMNPDEINQKLEACRKILLLQRSKRIRPQLDDKVLLGWNALTITALAKAFAATGEEQYRERALDCIRFLETSLQQAEGGWFHTWKNGQARIPAFLDDLAYLVQAYIHLQEITGDGSWLHKARITSEAIISGFEDADTGFFYFTHSSQKDIIVRKKEVYDGAVPSANAVMAQNLYYLSIVFDLPQWGERSRRMLLSIEKAILRYPSSFGVWAITGQLITKGMIEIAIVGQQAASFLCPVLERFLPNKILQAQETNSDDFPLLAGKSQGLEEGKTAFYLCKNYACEAPFWNIRDLLAKV